MSETRDPDIQARPISLAGEADFILGPLEVRPSLRQVVAGGRSETVEPRVMQVFVALRRARGEVVSRDELIRTCWAGRVVGDDAINSCVAKVRALARLGGAPAFEIETIPRVGYRLRALAPKAGESSVAPIASRPSAPRKWAMAALAALAAVLVGVGGWLLASRPPQRAIASAQHPAAAIRIAVLPFDAIGPGDDVRTFAKGVADQIIDVLDDNQVQTVSRTESASLQGSDRDAAAQKLGAEFILDGTVQRGESGLHATVHLDHTPTHTTLWTASFDQGQGGSLNLQAQVAARAADEIRQALLARAPGEGEIDDAALAIYLKARDNMRQPIDAPTMMRQVYLHRQVVARAPGFSLGYSGLAAALALDARFAEPDEARDMRAEARRDAIKALKLNPRDGDAYFAQGMLTPVGDWAEREALFRRGLKAQPNHDSLQSWLGDVLAGTGRVDEGIVQKQRALMNDPLSPAKTADLAARLASNGRCAEAVSTIERATRIWPTYPQIREGRVYTLANCGGGRRALAVLDAAARPPGSNLAEPGTLAVWRAYAAALGSGDPQAAAAAAARTQILAAVAARQFDRGLAIEMLARLGAVDQAFALADAKLAAPHAVPPDPFPFDSTILFNNNTRLMRKDPRFMALVAQLGLTDFWRTTGDWPDFCRQPGLPYDCRQAAKATATGRASRGG